MHQLFPSLKPLFGSRNEETDARPVVSQNGNNQQNTAEDVNASTRTVALELMSSRVILIFVEDIIDLKDFSI